jgi:hypothetical protein
MNERLTEVNFILFAAQHYDNPQCIDTVEFFDDLKRFKYIKRLFNKYIETGDLRERLILNHLIILYNVFGPIETTRMLFLKLQGYEKHIKPFLIFLNYMPEKIEDIGLERRNILSSDIEMDMNIINALRELKNHDN